MLHLSGFQLSPQKRGERTSPPCMSGYDESHGTAPLRGIQASGLQIHAITDKPASTRLKTRQGSQNQAP